MMKAKHRFCADTMFLTFYKDITLTKVAYFSKVYYSKFQDPTVSEMSVTSTSIDHIKRYKGEDVVQWHDVHTKFHENLSIVSKVTSGGGAHSHNDITSQVIKDRSLIPF
jgi:hypothetical protein